MIADPITLTNTLSGQGVYSIGDTITLNASGATNYEFKGWYLKVNDSYELSSTNRVFSFISNADSEYKAVFERKESPIPIKPSGTGGGGGTGDTSSDTTPTTDIINNGIASVARTGLYTIWCPTNSQLSAFADYLYSDNMKSVMASIYESIASLGGKVTDYLFTAFHLPVSIDSSKRTTDAINAIGFFKIDSALPCDYASTIGGVYDMGSIQLDRVYGNALDYKCNLQIYLPYIGYVTLDPSIYMGKLINLKYYVSYLDGDCIAQLTVDDRVTGQYTGSMIQDMPIGQNTTYQNAITTGARYSLSTALNIATGGLKL